MAGFCTSEVSRITRDQLSRGHLLVALEEERQRSSLSAQGLLRAEGPVDRTIEGRGNNQGHRQQVGHVGRARLLGASVPCPAAMIAARLVSSEEWGVPHDLVGEVEIRLKSPAYSALPT